MVGGVVEEDVVPVQVPPGRVDREAFPVEDRAPESVERADRYLVAVLAKERREGRGLLRIARSSPGSVGVPKNANSDVLLLR